MGAATIAIRACMIDGFGRFEEADYRRIWLFFDDVRYVLPAEIAGPLEFPPGIDRRPDFSVTRPELSQEQAGQLVELARHDAGNLQFRQDVMARVPRTELDYAELLVYSDLAVRERAPIELLADPVFAISYLLNKLLLISATTGAIPIVGSQHASELLLSKLGGQPARRRPGALVAPLKGISVAAFAAGLTFDFIPDDALAALDFARLVEFKQKNSDLLEQHQLHLIEVAQAFSGAPDGPEFADRLERLRIEALRRRAELDRKGKEAWNSLGLSLFEKAVAAGTAGFFSGLAVLRGHTIQDVLIAAGPAAISAAGAVVVGMADVVAKLRSERRYEFAYLLRAKEALAR